MGIVLTLIGIGLILIILEIFIVPGTTIVGFAGFVLVAIGNYYAFYYLGLGKGSVTLISTLIVCMLLYKLFTNSKLSKAMSLEASVTERIDHVNRKVSKGDVGVTSSRLSPVGKALINDELFEVDANGSFIEENSKIIVDRINKNRIFVSKIE